jgi:hypothetical protein
VHQKSASKKLNRFNSPMLMQIGFLAAAADDIAK